MSTSTLLAANLFNVNGLIAVITGGGTGIGLMMTKALSLNGASKIYILGRRSSVLQSATLQSPHNNIIPVVCDITSKESLQAAVDKIRAETGYINVLIANSGISGPQIAVSPGSGIEEFQRQCWESGVEEFTETFGTNVAGAWYSVIAFLGLLDEGNKRGDREGGLGVKSQVVLTSSIGGFNRLVPGGYAYGQSKAALTLMMKQLSTGLVPYGIRCNALAPGLFPSDLAAGLIGPGIFPKEKLPAERIGTEEEMAGCILFLTSRAGGYCNGLVLVVDGGRLSVMPATY